MRRSIVPRDGHPDVAGLALSRDLPADRRHRPPLARQVPGSQDLPDDRLDVARKPAAAPPAAGSTPRRLLRTFTGGCRLSVVFRHPRRCVIAGNRRRRYRMPGQSRLWPRTGFQQRARCTSCGWCWPGSARWCGAGCWCLPRPRSPACTRSCRRRSGGATSTCTGSRSTRWSTGAGSAGFSRNARQVRLSEFGLRADERFTCEYDFTARWRHDIRAEEMISPRRAARECPA